LAILQGLRNGPLKNLSIVQWLHAQKAEQAIYILGSIDKGCSRQGQSAVGSNLGNGQKKLALAIANRMLHNVWKQEKVATR
jgi:hypothetical protein